MNWRRVLLAVPAATLGIVFFAWPMVSIIATGVTGDPSRVTAVLTSSSTFAAIWFTLWQAAVSTALTLAIGMPIAFVLSRFEFRGRRLVRTIVTVPFVLPTVVVAMAFLELAGPGGILGVDLSGTIWLVLAAHVFFNLAVVVRTVGGLWSHLDPDIEAAAAALGASPSAVFRTVTFPLLRPAIAAASAIVFLFSFTSFGVVLLLGGPSLATIEVEIYRSAALVFDLPAAAVLALIQLIGVTAGLLLYARSQERSPIRQHLLPAAAIGRRPRGGERWFVAMSVSVASIVSLVPIAVIVIRAATAGGGLGFSAFRAMGAVDPSIVDVPAAIGNSARFALVAAAIALAAAIPAAVLLATRARFGRWIDTLIMLPIGSSAVTLGFGFVVALDAPIDLRAWWGLVPVAHALVAMPFVVRATIPVIKSISPRVKEAAATLGASPRRVWRTVDLPILTPAAAGAAALALVISLGEFGATLFVARPGGQTMTLAIFRLLGRPGSTNLAAALGISVVLIALTAVVVAVVDRARLPGVGGF